MQALAFTRDDLIEAVSVCFLETLPAQQSFGVQPDQRERCFQLVRNAADEIGPKPVGGEIAGNVAEQQNDSQDEGRHHQDGCAAI